MQQTLLDIKRTTKLTTQDIARQAKLPIADVFVLEVGGYSTEEAAQRVVAAFNQLSGMQITVDQISFVVARNLV